MAITWDTSEMQVSRSDLVQASAVAEGVRLDFGASMPRESGDIVDLRNLRRIVLEKEAATNLLKLLKNLIYQND
jgi:hypothetical protein